MRKFIFLPVTVIIFSMANAQVADVLHYNFSIQLNDSSNIIRGDAAVSVRILRSVTSISLDLVGKQTNGKGMQVTAVKEGNRTTTFSHSDETLTINTVAKAGDTTTFFISYEGIPNDGLIIDSNKYGHRTFFSDNWPNRAHNWIPCIDHPSDKAPVDFIVTAPDHYQVVSNGLQVEENNMPNHLKQTHWKETIALPTKIMAIGVADFAVNNVGQVDCIPVSSWVYPENKETGFYDYALAKDILPFFIKNIGPFAYEKLANVQSKTMYGGVENASAIFYAENSIKGDRKVEALLTHEIAHQWFGDAVTEKNWPHIWLSEGFATYMTHFYLEKKYGTDTLLKRLRQDRQQVIAFSKRKTSPVVDTAVTSNFMQLLNANSYQKGGWVLHMLRRKLGDAVFMKGIRNYYAQYAGKNANTEDFRKEMEAASGQQLEAFFRQWLYTPGQPVIHGDWKFDQQKKTITIIIEQNQPQLFDFPIDVAIESNGKTIVRTIAVKNKTTVVTLPLKGNIASITLDPNVDVLYEGSMKQVE